MSLKNLRISTQLKLGFGVLLLLVTVLGTVSYTQTVRLHTQTKFMYEHPLKVRQTIGNLKADIYAIHRDMKNLFLGVDEKELADDLSRIETWNADVSAQLEILYSQYLGPRSDIDRLKQAYVTWNSMREETIRLLRAGRSAEAVKRTKASGIAGKQAADVLSKLEKIDVFAQENADSLFAKSNEINSALSRQLVLLVAVILLFSLGIIYWLLHNINQPLTELTAAARSFSEGDLEVRSGYESDNEFGLLSASFNMLAESVQANTDLSRKAADLARLMLSEDDAKSFFKVTLTELAGQTGSQVAAVYLLNEDESSFDHFVSIGLGNNAKPSFSAGSFEGEFGAALASRQTQHLKSIPEDSRFAFHTASGTFIPREILTIPVVNSDVVAIISLATLGAYDEQALRLIDTIHPTLNSRIVGILAYNTVKLFSAQLEQQNSELEVQKTELTAQSIELTAQNSELEMQKKQLDESSRLKTTFLSNMSHELRTPLNSVIALSGVLGRRLVKQIPDEEYSYLEVIERNGKNLLLLINDILDIARIEAGREEVEISIFNANSLLAEIAETIRPQAVLKGIELSHADSEPDLLLSSDAVKCRYILQNLIGNAVKFTDAGTVTVSARQSETGIEIKVSDSGIGISEAHLEHIFDEFRQADSSTSRRFGGTGLGLTIAKKYANLLGGTISVKSTPGEGSEFTLRLPASYAAENRANTVESGGDFKHAIRMPPGKETSAAALKTILLVEDSEPAIIQLKDILEEDGYQILVSRDGAEALAIIEQTIPDAIILDLMMPGIDGFEVLRVIRDADRTAHIPVLILSAKQISKDELQFLKRNNVHQLIQKGDVKRSELQMAVAKMTSPETVTPVKPHRQRQAVEGKPLVLVVEDNPDNMITVKALLSENYTVIEAVDGSSAIAMVKVQKPDLVLMDIALPGMDGIEVFKIMRNDLRLQHVPIIALTASAMTSDRETILAHGFDDYIAKPINYKQFFKTIHEVLYGE